MARVALLLAALVAVEANILLMPSPYSWRCEPRNAGEEPVCIKQRKSSVEKVGMSHSKCLLTCGKFGSLFPKPSGPTQLGKDVSYTLPQDIKFTWSVVPQVEQEELIKGAIEYFKENLLKLHPDYEHLINAQQYDQFFNQQTPDVQQPRQNTRRARHMTPANKFYHFHTHKTGELTYPEHVQRHYMGQPFFESTSPDLLKMTVNLRLQNPEYTRLHLKTNEAYSLKVVKTPEQTIEVDIFGDNFFGVRHGLETLSQLIAYCEETDSLQIVTPVEINDKPAYPYRGLIVDTSRNFMSVEALERTLCGMAASKLNTFHWHITDSNSFPMYLNSLPKMAYYGAHSYSKIYYPEDIQHIVEYGLIRGIRVLPELDAPAHVGNGWQWGPEDNLGELAVCVNQEPWQKYCVQPPCGQLNIANPNIYPVLGKIYKEMIKNFGPLDLFHYGGDEVNVNCWNSSTEVNNWMSKKFAGKELTDQDYYAEWSSFQDQNYQQFTKANEGREIPGIIWTSHLTEKGHTDRYLDPKKYIIQIWSNQTDPLIEELLRKNYSVIFSNYDTMYLDCGFGNWVDDGNNWCAPFKEWQKLYDNGPRFMANNMTNGNYRGGHGSQLLGGEAAIWSEKVDDSNLDSRVWPRAAALGERLWTDPEHDWHQAEHRLITHRQRLVQRGVRADRIQPQWCHENQGLCYLDKAL